MFDLTGRTALVTGASGGLGGAIARALHAQGATVALSGTRREALEALAAELKDRAHPAPCDLADAAAADALVPAVEAALGSLDILVNNAGVTRDSLFVRMKDADWESVLAINLTAAFRLSRAALKGMMRRRYGRIINIASVVGVSGNAGPSQLCRREGRHDRHVQVACRGSRDPGHHRELHRPWLHQSPMTEALDQKQREAILASVPMGRLGSGEEIGAAAVYLASSEAAYVTGLTLHVNGGMAMI